MQLVPLSLVAALAAVGAGLIAANPMDPSTDLASVQHRAVTLTAGELTGRKSLRRRTPISRHWRVGRRLPARPVDGVQRTVDRVRRAVQQCAHRFRQRSAERDRRRVVRQRRRLRRGAVPRNDYRRLRQPPIPASAPWQRSRMHSKQVSPSRRSATSTRTSSKRWTTR